MMVSDQYWRLSKIFCISDTFIPTRFCINFLLVNGYFLCIIFSTCAPKWYVNFFDMILLYSHCPRCFVKVVVLSFLFELNKNDKIYDRVKSKLYNKVCWSNVEKMENKWVFSSYNIVLRMFEKGKRAHCFVSRCNSSSCFGNN